RDAEALSQSFIHSKEKGLVFLNWSSDGAPKLIAREGGQAPAAGSGFVVEEVARIQRAVSEVFKERAVERVRTSLGDHRHLASHGHAIFGAEGVGDHTVLADSFDPERTAILRGGSAGGQ